MEIKEVVHRMFETASVLEKNTSPTDINKSSDLVVEILSKFLLDSKKIDDLYGILNKEKIENITEVMKDLFVMGILFGIVERDEKTLIPMLEENKQLQQNLEEFQKRKSKFELNMFG